MVDYYQLFNMIARLRFIYWYGNGKWLFISTKCDFSLLDLFSLELLQLLIGILDFIRFYLVYSYGFCPDK